MTLLVKADVQGTVQALEDSLLKLPQEEVRVNIVRAGAGGITENDVTLAMASDAIIVGFNVRPSAGARELAERGGLPPPCPLTASRRVTNHSTTASGTSPT